MVSNVHILDQPDSLKGPFASSVVLHVSAFVLIALLSVTSRTPPWGDSHPGGGSAMLVGVVGQVPLPAHSGKVNPVANDTESQVPEPKPEKVQRTKVEEPDRNAVEIPSRHAIKKPSPKATSVNKYRAQQIDQPNQLYSTAGQALTSPMMGLAGSGGIEVGRGSPFGDRYGYYVDLLRQKVAQKWRTTDVDARIRTAPPAIVTFKIRRDGSVYGTRIAQSSGNLAIDLSAERAIADAAPFPPLPAGFDKSEVPIEFWFELKR